MRRNLLSTMAAASVALGSVGLAMAGGPIAFDNMPLDSYNVSNGWTVGAGPIFGGTDYDAGDSFTPTQTGFLSDIWMATTLHLGPNELDVALRADAGGAPGAVLESWHLVGALNPWGGHVDPAHISADGTIPLTAGVQYWITASTPLDSSVVWHLNDIGDIGAHAGRVNNGSWNVTNNVRGAIRVGLVPEPATFGILALGALGLLRRR